MAGVALLALLVGGTVLVLRPFIASLLWAAIMAYASWPVYEALYSRLRGRPGAAATAMTLLLLLAIVAPFALMGVSLVDSAAVLLRVLRDAMERPLPEPPEWLGAVPLVGTYLTAKWAALLHEDMGDVLLQARQYLQQLPLKDWAVVAAAAVGRGVLLISFSVLICFFFYRDGPTITAQAHTVMERLTGHRAKQLIEVIAGTVSRVVNGILGTALAQSVLALLGFWVAGVPGAVLLALLTFFLSIIPMGPPLVWVPAAAWLFAQDQHGWAIFLALYGLFVISSIDNFVKPYLISRGGSLPLLLVFMGVLGGVLAFGFIGVFLGPVILAVAFALLSEWIRPKGQPDGRSDDPAATFD